MGFERKKILVLGAGYAGLQTVVKLQKLVSVQDCEITLINKNSYHYESTWLHETAAGTINYEQGIYPITSVIDASKVKFVPAEVTAIDKDNQIVNTTQGEFSFDYLVMALGFESETFGITGMDEHAMSITNVESARKIKQHIEERFAHYSESEVKDPNDLKIIVGGAGFTGVELLGELAERVPELCSQYNVNAEDVKLICIEAAPKMLPMFSEELVNYAVNALESKGVEFKLATPIVAANEQGFVVKENDEEKTIEANTAIWTAGVRGNALMDTSFDGVKRGRIIVEDDLSIEGYPNIFVIGDCSAVMNGEGENARPYPTTAQIAMQQGDHLAKNLKAVLDGDKTSKFNYDEKGTVCSLGPNDAVGHVMGKDLQGKKASFMKKVIDTRAIYKIGGPLLAYKKGKVL